MNAVSRHAPPAASLPSSPRSFLAFDFGTRRIGVASGNSVTREATPLTVLDGRGDAAFAAIGTLIGDWGPSLLVVGVPRHPDGSAHETTRQAERFARRLEGRFGLAVVRVDERYSSVEAPGPGRPRGPRRPQRRGDPRAVLPGQRWSPAMSQLALDAEALYGELKRGVARLLDDDTLLVGIWSGGAWLAQRLQRDLRREGDAGVITSALHRDDFGQRGMAQSDATRLPWSIDGRAIVLVDDVLHTGRTIRAVINELFDFGRPSSVSLAVLVDRNGRELPIEATFAAVRVTLSPDSRLRLARTDDGRFTFSVDATPGEGQG